MRSTSFTPLVFVLLLALLLSGCSCMRGQCPTTGGAKLSSTTISPSLPGVPQ